MSPGIGRVGAVPTVAAPGTLTPSQLGAVPGNDPRFDTALSAMARYVSRMHNKLAAKPKVLLLGGGGVPNFGDELVIDSWLDWYRAKGVTDITVSGSHVDDMAELFGQYEGVRFSQEMRWTRQLFPGSFVESVRAGLRFIEDRGNDPSPLSTELLTADLIHVYGGGYLNDLWPTHGFILGAAAGAQRRAGTRLVGTGLGLGPFGEWSAFDIQTLKSVWGRFDWIEVRDQDSFRALRPLTRRWSTRVFNGLDDTFLRELRVRSGDGKALHLVLHSHSAWEVVRSALSQEIIGGFDHLYFWICLPADSEIYAQVSAEFPGFEAVTYRELIAAIPVHEVDCMVTSRFHPHLLGARAGMSGYYVTDSDYYETKHRSVVSLGSSFGRLTAGKTLTSFGDVGRRPDFDDRSLVVAKNARMNRGVRL